MEVMEKLARIGEIQDMLYYNISDSDELKKELKQLMAELDIEGDF